MSVCSLYKYLVDRAKFGFSVGVHWHIRILQAVIAVAAKDSVTIGQIVSEELMKILYYLGTQAIFNKYHSDLDPELKDLSITFTQFAKCFEHNVTSEREFQLTKTYEDSPFPNNDFEISIYNILYMERVNQMITFLHKRRTW